MTGRRPLRRGTQTAAGRQSRCARARPWTRVRATQQSCRLRRRSATAAPAAPGAPSTTAPALRSCWGLRGPPLPAGTSCGMSNATSHHPSLFIRRLLPLSMYPIPGICTRPSTVPVSCNVCLQGGLYMYLPLVTAASITATASTPLVAFSSLSLSFSFSI